MIEPLDALLAQLSDYQQRFDKLDGWLGTSKAKPLWAEYFDFGMALCDAYLAGTDLDRATIRREVISHPTSLLGFLEPANHAIRQVKSAEDSLWLRRALAAVSIQDNQVDVTAALDAIGNIYIRACEAGLNPDPYLHEIAAKSSRDPSLDSRAMYDILTQFTESLYFHNYIAPHCPKADS